MDDDWDPTHINEDELATFQGQLRFALYLAERWGRYRVPPGQQVMIVGLHVRSDVVVREGVAVVGPRSGGEGVLLADCTIEGCDNAVAASEAIIERINSAISP